MLAGGEGSSLHLINSDLTGNINGLEVGHGSCRLGGVADYEPPPRRAGYTAGTITGWGNYIPGPDEPGGNNESGIFYHWHGYDVSFLTEPKPAGT